MNKWYQGIVVEHKEIDNKMYHCFDDENFEKLTNERNEQLKEIERLHSIIKEVREYIKNNTKEGLIKDKKYFYSPEQANDILEILEKENK